MIQLRLLITYWFNDFLRGNLVSFCILWCSNFCFIQTWYQPRMQELYRGFGGMFPRKKIFENWTLGNAIPAFPGSNAINSYVYFVELFSESRYSWLPSRSTKIYVSQVFKTKIHGSYMFCNYDSWFRFHPRLRWSDQSDENCAFSFFFSRSIIVTLEDEQIP